jgi:hypothetical protein
MPKNRANFGPGAGRMGGIGAKPVPPKTPMAGKPPMGPPPIGGGAPKPPPPPMGGGAGAPPPMPGGGMGGSGGFAKGGVARKFEKGGSVGIGGSDTKARVGRGKGYK